MRLPVYLTLIIIMYVGVPFCAYGYYYYSEIEREQVNTHALLMNTNAPINSDQQAVENDVMNGEKNTSNSEKLGFLGAAIALFLIPTLMLVFKGKLLKL